MTNGDRVRQMTDEEMAKAIAKIHGVCPSFCPMAYDCDGYDCDYAWLDWLKQEVNDGD